MLVDFIFFLTQRPQFVLINHKDKTIISSVATINTGVPQGTVSLVIIYTDACRRCFSNIPILKHADDTSFQLLRP